MKHFISRTHRLIDRNSSTILASLAVSGVFTTGYLAAKAGYQSAFDLLEEQVERDTPLESKEITKIVWKRYIPAAVSGALTITCIVTSNRISSGRAAAMAAAYSLSEQAFHEYKDKVVEQIGAKKEESIRDQIATDKVLNNPPPNDLIVLGGENVLCCELHTGRYFYSDMHRLQTAKNRINERVLQQLYVTLDEFYDEVGLVHTSQSDKMGWDSDKLMDFKISTVMSPQGVPCLAFDYNYLKAL